MGFIRENILKIVTFVIILVIAIIIFAFLFRGNTANKLSATSYTNMEKMLASAAKNYTNDNKKLLPNSEKETNKINLDTLVNGKYIERLTSLEDTSVECTGYVQITYNNGNYSYIPYLKCGNDYETKTIANYIIDNSEIVTSGDGLYKIGEKYVYRGENPNNYLLLGKRLYRIIDINGNDVRLISNSRIEYYTQWDDRYNVERDEYVGINNYSVSRLKEFFEEIYNEKKDENDFKYEVFSKQEKEKIVSHDICIGKRNLENGEINSYGECQKVEPNQMMSLITVSDVARASIDQNCKSIYDKSCINYNYFSNIGNSIFTLTGVSNNTYEIFYITDGVADVTNSYNTFAPNIVVYINESSNYLSGTGTNEDPYRVR